MSTAVETGMRRSIDLMTTTYQNDWRSSWLEDLGTRPKQVPSDCVRRGAIAPGDVINRSSTTTMLFLSIPPPVSTFEVGTQRESAKQPRWKAIAREHLPDEGREDRIARSREAWHRRVGAIRVDAAEFDRILRDEDLEDR